MTIQELTKAAQDEGMLVTEQKNKRVRLNWDDRTKTPIRKFDTLANAELWLEGFSFGAYEAAKNQ